MDLAATISPRQNDSPPPQHSSRSGVGAGLLGSFLGRGRPRQSESHIQVSTSGDPLRELSPNSTHLQPPSPRRRQGERSAVSPTGPSAANHPQTTTGLVAVSPSTSGGAASGGAGSAIGNMLRRRRSGGNISAPTAATSANAPALPGLVPTTSNTANGTDPIHAISPTNSQTHRIRLVPHLDSRRSLKFDPISRDLKENDLPLRIGRFTDRSGLGLSAVNNALNSHKIAFKSKVVSRAHAEIWVTPTPVPGVPGGAVGSSPYFYIKDTKSSSGTFLNHTRLSAANTESRAFPLKDGDILQLGVDYQGGTEDIYKSVKIRIEVGKGREWQMGINKFNTNALKNLKALAGNPVPAVSAAKDKDGKKKKSKSTIPDCCICLFAISLHQSLFISPCSHTFHYKCIRPLLESHHPAFSCPLCRTFANLDEDVEVDDDVDWDEDLEDEDAVDSESGGPPGLAAAPSASLLISRPERDREAGAETEVEDHPVITTLRNRARGVGIAEGEEEEMSEGEDPSPSDQDMLDVLSQPGNPNSAEGSVFGSAENLEVVPMPPPAPADDDVVLLDDIQTADMLLDENGVGGGEPDATLAVKRKR